MLFPVQLVRVLVFAAAVSGLAAPGGGGLLPAADKLARVLKAEADLDTARVEVLLQHAEQALKTWAPASPPFFVSATERAGIVKAFTGTADLGLDFQGGFRFAERTRVIFSRRLEDTVVEPEQELEQQLQEDLLAAVDIRGSFAFDRASHAEFLEAVHTVPGVDKSQIGDVIVVGDRGANVLCFPEMVAPLCRGLRALRSVPVETTPLLLSQLALRPPSRKELTLVEASDRLDAVASAGFGLSRAKMVKSIEGGEVLVNFKAAKSAAAPLRAGDVVVLRGQGQLEVSEVAITAKGRVRVKCARLS